MGYENFDRQYRLAAGPGGAEAFEIGETSLEHPEALHVSFSFQKSDLTTQNTGKIEIYNLSKAHLAVLEKKDCIVSFRAGYGTHMPLIFTGFVSFVKTVADGADRKTEIEVLDSLVNIRDTYVSVSYNGVVNWKTILDDTAAQIGVVIVYSYNATTFIDCENGFAYVGPAKNILTKGCECNGMTWSIQNGVLQIKMIGDAMSDQVYVLSASTGMIGSPEKVTIKDSEQTTESMTGWDVTYFLNGAINVNDFVRLESEDVTGYFYVYSQDISGDNVSGDWVCKSRLLPLTNMVTGASAIETDNAVASNKTLDEDGSGGSSGDSFSDLVDYYGG